MFISNNVNKTSFNAKFVKNVPVLKKNENEEYDSLDVKLLEFELPNEKGKVRELCDMPQFSSYGSYLYNDLSGWKENEYKNKHCYVLVKENENNYSDINKDNVLGLFTYYHNNYNLDLIPYFMTSSDYQSGANEGSEYSKIGTGMSDAIKSMYPESSIKVIVLDGASAFWSKQDYKMVDENTMIYE